MINFISLRHAPSIQQHVHLKDEMSGPAKKGTNSGRPPKGMYL